MGLLLFIQGPTAFPLKQQVQEKTRSTIAVRELYTENLWNLPKCLENIL